MQLFISHLTTWLRTRRFSEPTFRSSGPQIIGIKGPDNPASQLLPIMSNKCCSRDGEGRRDKGGGGEKMVCDKVVCVKDGVVKDGV